MGKCKENSQDIRKIIVHLYNSDSSMGSVSRGLKIQKYNHHGNVVIPSGDRFCCLDDVRKIKVKDLLKMRAEADKRASFCETAPVHGLKSHSLRNNTYKQHKIDYTLHMHTGMKTLISEDIFCDLMKLTIAGFGGIKGKLAPCEAWGWQHHSGSRCTSQICSIMRNKPYAERVYI